MRLHRPVLLALALGAVLPVTAASAASGVAAAGSAVSSATLVTVSVGSLDLGAVKLPGHTASIGSLSALAQTVTSAAPAVSFVPVTLDGVQTGAVTVTPANSPQTVGALSTAALPLDVVKATSPSATLTATKAATGPVATLVSSLGSVELLGLPITVNGGVDIGSVTDGVHSQAGKTVKITNIALPNIADLLAALGIDIAKLPVDTISALVADLQIALDAAMQTAFDTADGIAKDAVDDLATKTATAATEATQMADATTAIESALAALAVPMTLSAWDAFTDVEQGALIALNGGEAGTLGSASTAYETAKIELAAANTAVTVATSVLNAATAALANLVKNVLGEVPLVKIGDAQIGTKAAVGASKVADVTGYVSGVEVLGTDVLEQVTGDSKVDAAKLVGDLADEVNTAIATVSGQLSTVLSAATGATGLVVPAPQVKVLTKQTGTGTEGAFGTASAAVTALSITMGSVTVPRVYAIEDAAEMAGIGAISTGFKTAPLGFTVGTLADAAKFRPASTTATPATPGSGPTHPATGGPAGLAIVAMVGMVGAFGLRRHLKADS